MKDSIEEVNCIFEQPWWLDAVAPGRWKSIEICQDGNIIGRLPYVESKRAGFNVIGMPPCTQTLGPWIKCKVSNKVKLYAQLKNVIFQILDKIPNNANVDLYLDSSLKYVLPFRWKGYRYEPQFSYRFSDLSNPDDIFKGIKDSRKSVIRKAEKELIVKDNASIDILMEMQNKTFKRQGRKNPIPFEVLRRIDDACLEHNARFLLTAEDKEGNIHSASYFVYDKNVCYYIMSGADPDYRNSGAGSLLIWEGIKRASRLSSAFDFEGSNIEDIETNFRSFGSDFIVHYRVFRLNLFLTLVDYIKPKIKNLIGYKQ